MKTAVVAITYPDGPGGVMWACDLSNVTQDQSVVVASGVASQDVLVTLTPPDGMGSRSASVQPQAKVGVRRSASVQPVAVGKARRSTQVAPAVHAQAARAATILLRAEKLARRAALVTMQKGLHLAATASFSGQVSQPASIEVVLVQPAIGRAAITTPAATVPATRAAAAAPQSSSKARRASMAQPAVVASGRRAGTAKASATARGSRAAQAPLEHSEMLLLQATATFVGQTAISDAVPVFFRQDAARRRASKANPVTPRGPRRATTVHQVRPGAPTVAAVEASLTTNMHDTALVAAVQQTDLSAGVGNDLDATQASADLANVNGGIGLLAVGLRP